MATDKIISLIGMPGSGKSTIGTALAARLNLELVDADGLIEAQEGQSLQEIMDGRGNAAFRAIEEQVLTGMPLFPSVISTGGSVVYSGAIMARLSAASTVVYLRAQVHHDRGSAEPGHDGLAVVHGAAGRDHRGA